MKKTRLTALTLAFILLFSFSAHALTLSSKGACSIDCATGKVLYQKNAAEQMVPASLTKIMTLYIIFEKLADKTLTKDTLIPISENAAKLSVSPEASNVTLYSGEVLPLETLICAIVAVSACASCTAVAEYISGSEAEFAKLMTQKAKDLGIQAYFADASGLSNYNQISPKGIADLTRIFIDKYPDVLNYTSKPSLKVRDKSYSSTNNLIKTSSSFFYSGADGFKTGTTSRAGSCLVATAQRNGARVITVVMNAPSNYYRYSDTVSLLNDGFAQLDFTDTHLFTTDIAAYIDSYEIPCCYSLGDRKELCIVAENLNSYGFNTHYETSSKTLYIYKDEAKEFFPMVCERTEDMEPLYEIYSQGDIKVVLVKNGEEIQLNNVYFLNYQCAISLDELGKYFSYSWDDSSRSAYMTTEK